MTYTQLYALLGSTLILFGTVEQGWLRLLAWPGFDFLILCVAHSRGAHGVFGKRPNGSLPLWSRLLFLPLLSYNTVFFHLIRLFRQEASRSVVTEHLVIGRRLLPSELVGEFDNYIDLTAEFWEPPAIRRSPAYRCFPILDGAAPQPEALGKVIRSLRPGRTFVHCAQGHGRTALFALAVLLTSGMAEGVEEGLRMLKSVRRGVHLSKDQRRCIEMYARRINQSNSVTTETTSGDSWSVG